MPASPWTCILWDVDGTLVDASEGILRRLTIALGEYGLPAPQHDDLVHWIGPPMYETFRSAAGMSHEQATEAVARYRAIGLAEGYTSGARLYPGVADLVADVADAGIAQATASSKPEVQVVALMEHFALSTHLQSMTGADAGDRTRSQKAEVVAEALRRLRDLGADTSRPVLVGDRHHDVTGGAVHGVPVIFARWGFSRPGEEDGAHATADDVDALRALLLDGPT